MLSVPSNQKPLRKEIPDLLNSFYIIKNNSPKRFNKKGVHSNKSMMHKKKAKIPLNPKPTSKGKNIGKQRPFMNDSMPLGIKKTMTREIVKYHL